MKKPSCTVEIVSVGQNAPRCHTGTHLHVLNLHLDDEGFICVDSAGVLWENEFGAREDVLCNDASHRNDVARAGTDLLAIGQGNVLGQAKVDEIILRGQGRNLTRNRDLLSVEGKTRLDDTEVEGQRFLKIFSSSRRSNGVGVRGSSLYWTTSTTDLIHYKLYYPPGCQWYQ